MCQQYKTFPIISRAVKLTSQLNALTR